MLELSTLLLYIEPSRAELRSAELVLISYWTGMGCEYVEYLLHVTACIQRQHTLPYLLRYIECLPTV